MKWLFIIVALLNIAYGGYNLFLADVPKTKKIKFDAIEKSHIVLLNELDAGGLKQLQEKTLTVKTIIDDIQQTEPDQITSETVAITKTQPVSDTKVESKPESDVNSDKDVAQSSPEPSKDVTENLCYKLGPFTKNVMNDIRLILEKEYQNQLSFGIETTSAITYYRIYIPPLESKLKIKETLATLDKNGLKDHYVMSIDGRKNAIALGVFKKRSAAEKIADKAAKTGSSTIIEAISDDKNSLYQLLIIFQKDQDTTRYKEIITQKKLISVECDK